MDIALIIDRLLPSAKFTQCHNYDDLKRTWTDDRPIPSLNEIEAEWAVYQQEKEACKYAENRRKEYPPDEEQLEAIMDHLAGDSTKLNTLQLNIAAVKTKHPKPI